MNDSIIRTICECMWRFERANHNTANLIVLGPMESLWFDQAIHDLLYPPKSDPTLQGTGKFYRGCRVLHCNEPGVWVGHCVTPLK